MSRQRVTISTLQSILQKNNLSEIKVDIYQGVHFTLNGHNLSSKRMSMNQAYDWLWAFIEGMRYQYAKEREPLDITCPFSVDNVIRGPHPDTNKRNIWDDEVTLVVKEIEDDRMRVDFYHDPKGWPYELIWPVEYNLYKKVGE